MLLVNKVCDLSDLHYPLCSILVKNLQHNVIANVKSIVAIA